jgi:hypothetical protein
MRPKVRRETREQDLFRSRLEQIIDLQHALVRLARAIDFALLGREVWRGLHGQAGSSAGLTAFLYQRMRDYYMGMMVGDDGEIFSQFNYVGNRYDVPLIG